MPAPVVADANAPIAAQLRELANGKFDRLIGGKNAEIDMPVTGIKPMPLHAFWPLGVTAAVLAGRMRDRLGM